MSGGMTPPQLAGNAPLLTKGQRGLLDSLTSLMGGQLGKGVEAYPGTYTPGQSPIQDLTFDNIMSLMSGKGPLQEQIFGGLSDQMKPFDPASTQEWWKGGVVGPMTETWKKDIVPGILESFAGADAAGSGPAMKAVSESGRRLNTDMGGMLASALYSAENADAARKMQAYGMGSQLPINLASLGLGSGAMERTITGEQMQEPYKDWMTSQPWANPWLQQLGTSLNTKAFSPMIQPGGYDPGMSGLWGIFGNLASAFMKSPMSADLF